MGQYTDRFLVQEGGNCKLLCRDTDHLYLVTFAKYHSKKMLQKLEKLPVAKIVEYGQEWKTEVIPAPSIRGFAVGGVEELDPIYLYSEKGRRTLLLREQLSGDYLDWFFSDLKKFQAPMDKRQRKDNAGYWRKERQNPEQKRQLRWTNTVLTIISAGCCAGLLLTKSTVWFVACGACLVVPVVLDIFLGAYFTLTPRKLFLNRFALSLTGPFGIVGLGMLVPGRPNYLAFPWELLKWAAIGALVCALLMLLAEEFRREKSLLGYAFLVSLVLCYGMLQMANQVLPQEAPETGVVQVVKLWKSGSTKSHSYNCRVQDADGSQHVARITRKFYESLEPGEFLYYYEYEGALGFEYFKLQEIES